MGKLADVFGQFGIQPFLEHTQILIALIDSRGELQVWNPAFQQVKKMHPEAANIQDFLTHPSQPIFAKVIKAREPQPVNLEFNGNSNNIRLTCLLVPLPDGKFLFFAEPDQTALDEKLTHLTNDLKQAELALEIRRVDLESVLAQANEISHTDPLTFLPNRRQIIADLQNMVITCDQSQKSLTIFILDIDHFKLVNDTFGHIAGDHTLRAMSARLQESIREDDEIGRYGGEEFIVLLPGTNEKSATKLAERLLGIVREMDIPFDGKTIKITISIGIAQYRNGQESWEELLKRADLALYQSKQNGRDRWTIDELYLEK